jgi:hypothetical protein
VETDLDARRIWSVKEYCSSLRKLFVISNMRIACSNAFWYTVNSLKLLIMLVRIVVYSCQLQPASCALLVSSLLPTAICQPPAVFQKGFAPLGPPVFFSRGCSHYH